MNIKLNLETAEVFVPDGLPTEQALVRTTHLAVGAHQDDLEIMAADGILQCFQRDDRWFCGVVVTNGSGSPRAGIYKDYSNAEMQRVRRTEQIKAAILGEYGAQVLLDYPSAVVKDGHNTAPTADILTVLKAAQPTVVYTHNLTDKHDTHIAVVLKVIAAIRQLPVAQQPRHLYGCEVWRDLDWMVDADKTAFDVSGQENLQAALIGVFDSQISGGKRYDLAVMGRRRANATYYASHFTDAASGLIYAMDLTPLITNLHQSPQAFAQEHVDRFAQDVSERLTRLQGD
jgi:LmbE family N-acetylglucosaminyl deacetylase